MGYVTPGTVGYQGDPAALTPYSPPGSGQPGAGNAPPGWSWQAQGLRSNNDTVSLDHVHVYGGLYWAGGKSLTITNSVIEAGTGAEFYCLAAKGTGGTINLTDTTLGWLSGQQPASGTDVGTVWDEGTLTPYVYNMLRCECSGSPQGVGPVTGAGSQFVNCVFQVAQNNTPVPNHLDGIFNDGADNVLIQGCWVDGTLGAAATAALFWQSPSSSAITGCQVISCYLTGGAFSLHNENGAGLQVSGCTFGGGIFGDARNDAPGTFSLWLGNAESGGSPVPVPGPLIGIGGGPPVSNQFWVSNPNSPSQGAGAALASSTAMTDISPAPQWVFPYYLYAGMRVRVTAYGVFSTAATPNLALAVYYGGAAAGTQLATSGNIATGTATNWPWSLSYNFRVTAIGASGGIWGQGKFDLGTSLTAFSAVALPSTAANPVTISTVSLNSLTVAAQWGTSSSSDTITCEDFIVELLN